MERLLSDKDDQVRDAAVRCLANNPTPGVADRLPRLFLAPQAGKHRAALVNALARLADPTVSRTIARALTLHAGTANLTGDDLAVAVGSARVLGQIGNANAERALAEARGKARGELHLAVCDAYLLCADAGCAKENGRGRRHLQGAEQAGGATAD